MKSLIPSLCFAAGAIAVAAVDYLPSDKPSAPELTPVAVKAAAPQAACLTSGNCTCGENCACTAMGECLNKATSTRVADAEVASPATRTVASPAAPTPTAGGVSYTAAMPAPQVGYRWDCSTGVCRQVSIRVLTPPVQQQAYYVNQPQYDRRGRFVGYRRVWYQAQPRQQTSYRQTRYYRCAPGRG